jgi:uncharacterized protein (DUF1330 family)
MSDHVNPTREQFAAFAGLPSDGPIHMLNMIRFRERAAYDDGREMSGAHAYKTYVKETEPIFTRVGGRQFWIGRFDLMVIGPEDERWDLIFIAEYPSSAAFLEMVRDPAYQEAAKHRTAAVEDSRLIRLAPMAGKGFAEALR